MVVNGHWYPDNTSEELISLLEKLHQSRQYVLVTWADGNYKLGTINCQNNEMILGIRRMPDKGGPLDVLHIVQLRRPGVVLYEANVLQPT